VVLLSGGEIELDVRMPRKALHRVHHDGVDVRILLEPIAQECVDGPGVPEGREGGCGERLLQVALTAYARVDDRAIGAKRPEEFLSEGLAVDAEVFLNGHIPGPPEFRLGVPALDQNAINVEENLHVSLSVSARDIGLLDISTARACTWR
jgi:hypothetical protein